MTCDPGMTHLLPLFKEKVRRNGGNGEVYLLSNLRRAYLATARSTVDHDEIRKWVECKGGHPAPGRDRFFKIFDDSGIKFLYDPEGHVNKFVRDE
ncbi:MAG: hypothetical protein JO324_08415 [Candidatus Eremiobacteraeota bacterium]|nr:hypothetical protein [Candidatus Eremiobacteraeota bacterium]